MLRGMDLRSLEYFVAVADEGSFTRAAARLYVTQPTISSAIQSLERELGEQLFDRLPRGIALSDGGRVLLPHARKCLAAVDDAKSEFSARAGLLRGELRLGSGGGVEHSLVPDLLGAFHEKYSGIDVELTEATSIPLLTLVEQGRLHAAVIARPPGALPDGIASSPMFTDRLVAVFDSTAFALAAGPVALEALAGRPVITYPATSALRAALESAAAEQALTIPVRYAANDARLQVALARQRVGIAVCAGSDPALGGVDDLEIRAIEPAVSFTKTLVWRDEALPSAPLRAFLELWDRLR